MLLNSIIHGHKPQHLLILHGLFGQSDNWNTLGKKYAEYFTTHLIDLRNHGRSPHSDNVSLASMADDLAEYMQHHQIETAFVLGHSLGGKVVMEFAFNHPNLVDKLVVVDMVPKAYPPHHQGILKGLTSVNFSQIKSRKEVDAVLRDYIPEMAVRQFLLKNVYRKAPEKYAFRFNLKALNENYMDLVANYPNPKTTFNKPTLFIGGEKSKYILPEDQPLIHRLFPQAKIETVSNAGHWLHAENPTEFFDKTLGFLL